MTERKRGLPSRPVDPDLLPAQVAFKAVSDEILRHKTRDGLSEVEFLIETDPSELLQRLAQGPLQDMLLRPGESLSMSHPDEDFPDFDLVVGETPVIGVSLAHWNREERKWRVDPNGPKQHPHRIIYYPGEVDWTREIDINLWFGEGRRIAAQRLTLYDSSRSAGILPQVTRAVYAPDYAESGYEGHKHKSRPFTDEAEVVYFVDLARELFGKRKPDTPPAR